MIWNVPKDYEAYSLNISAANNEAPSVSVFLNLNFSVDYHPVFVFTAGSYADLDPFNNNMRWDNSANWDVGQVPTADAIVVINNHAPDNTALGSVPIYRLDLSGGTLTTSGMLIQKLNLSGGTLAGGAITIVSNGVFNWSGGTFTGIGSIPSGATLNLSGASHKYLGINTTLNLVGNVVWTGTGSLYGAYGDQINNTGTFSIQGDALLSNYTGGAPAPVFNNNGLIQKTNSPGVTTMAADAGGWTFNNNGTLDIASGVLSSQTQLYLNHGTVIAGAGILRVDGSTTLVSGTNKLQPGATFELAGGTVTGVNAFAGAGAFNWSGGTVTATITLQSNIAFNISGAAIKTLSTNSTINSAGSATWTGTGAIYAGYGSVLNNTGSFVVQNDALYYNNTGGATLPQFSNYGSFTKTNSPGTTDFNSQYGTAFNNYGTVKVQSGKLALGGGGTSQSASFTVAAGAEMDLTGGTNNFGSGLNFSGGLTRMLGGILNLTGTNGLANNAAFEIAGGVVTGTNTFTGTGAFNWNDGTISATLTSQSNIAFNISGAAIKTLSPNSTINSAGSAIWTGAGAIYAGYGSALNNVGSFVVQNDTSYYNNTAGAPPPQFSNYGTFTKTNSPGTTDFNSQYGTAFNNYGSVKVQSGRLALGGGGNSLNSSFTAAAGSVIDYYGGTFFHNGNLELNGPGTNRVNGATVVFNGVTNLLAGAAIFEIAAGQINGTNTFSGVGAVHWSGGSVSAAFNLQPNIALNISGASAKVLSPGGNFTVAGNTLWNGAGDIYVGYASTFINNGTFSVQNDAQFYNNTGGAPIPVFVNNGTFLKNGGTGATTFLPNYGGVTLNNTGTLDLQSGTLVIQAGYATAPSARLQISIGGPTAATQFGTEYFYSPALFDGTLAVSLVNGFMPTNGQSFVLANYGSRTGQFANIEVPALTPELQWSLSYGATALTLSVIRPHRVSSPVRLANGYFQFTLSGASAARAIIDASENLVSWQPIRTNAPFNGSFLFDDANAASYTNRFYRIRIEP